MSKSLDRLEKLATSFAQKLEKHAQEMTYDFNPEQDLLALKAANNMKKAQNAAVNAVPESFSGTVNVGIKVAKDKSFTVVSNVKEAAQAIKANFDAQIKAMLASAGPVKKDVVWNWFAFKVE